MPALGADMQFGTIVDWRVKAGDTVKRGDVVALVETEKGVIEVEIFDSGVIESLVVSAGTESPVGGDPGDLAGKREEIEPQPWLFRSPGPRSRRCRSRNRRVSIPSAAAARPKRPAGGASRRWRENALRNSASIYPGIAGSGGDGSITLADIERAVEGPKPAAHRPRRQRSVDRVWIWRRCVG